MKLKDSLESVGIPVKDIYGREIGEFSGYTLDYAGNVQTIGVESGGHLVEFSSSRILSAKKEVLILPDWKAEARESGFESEILEAKLKSIEKMLESGEINRRIYEEIYRSFVAPRQKQQILLQRISRRLDELQHRDDGIDLFLTRVRMQANDALSSGSSYSSIKGRCASMKDTNESERRDLISVQDLIQRYFAAKGDHAPTEQEEELVLSNEHDDSQMPALNSDERPEETVVSQTYGTLKSLSV